MTADGTWTSNVASFINLNVSGHVGGPTPDALCDTSRARARPQPAWRVSRVLRNCPEAVWRVPHSPLTFEHAGGFGLEIGRGPFGCQEARQTLGTRVQSVGSVSV